MKKSAYEQYSEKFEQDAEAEYAGYVAQPAASLIDLVKAGRFGTHYQLWRALADTGTLRDAVDPLLAVLRSSAPYLVRYHCAAALIKLARTTHVTPVELSTDLQPRAAAIDRFARELRERL